MSEKRSERFLRIAAEVGDLVRQKNEAYGDSFGTCGDFLRLLYPDGILPSQYGDALALARTFDKQMRIATSKDAFGESPWRDIAGYAVLGAEQHERDATPSGPKDDAPAAAPAAEPAANADTSDEGYAASSCADTFVYAVALAQQLRSGVEEALCAPHPAHVRLLLVKEASLGEVSPFYSVTSDGKYPVEIVTMTPRLRRHLKDNLVPHWGVRARHFVRIQL